MPTRKAQENAVLYIIQAYETEKKPAYYCNGDGLVYGVYKIGTSNDPVYRLRKLAAQTNDTKFPKNINAHGLRLVRWFPRPRGDLALRLEGIFHHYWFKDRQLTGEWFYLLPEEIANFIITFEYVWRKDEHTKAHRAIHDTGVSDIKSNS